MTNDDRFRLDRIPATEDDWRDAVDGVLKGRPFEKVLVNQTAGGLDIQPLYAPASTEPILPVDPHRVAYGWDIRQRHEATSPSACQAAVLDDLEHGVTSIELGTPATAWGLDELRDALEGVLLDIAPVVLAPHTDLGSARALVDLLDERGDALTKPLLARPRPDRGLRPKPSSRCDRPGRRICRVDRRHAPKRRCMHDRHDPVRRCRRR